MTETDGEAEPRGRFVASADEPFTRGVIRGKHELIFDEPEFIPVGAGEDAHPWPVDYLVASLAACQVSVLEQCLEKARIDSYEIEATADIDARGAEAVPAEMPENTGSRIEHVAIDIDLEVPAADEGRARRCLDVYDKGCIVGRSLRAGIDYTPTTSLETS